MAPYQATFSIFYDTYMVLMWCGSTCVRINKISIEYVFGNILYSVFNFKFQILYFFAQSLARRSIFLIFDHCSVTSTGATYGLCLTIGCNTFWIPFWNCIFYLFVSLFSRYIYTVNFCTKLKTWFQAANSPKTRLFCCLLFIGLLH